MSIHFDSVCKTIGEGVKVIAPHPNKILMNLRTASERDLDSEFIYTIKATQMCSIANLEHKNLLVLNDLDVFPKRFYSVDGLNMIIVNDPITYKNAIASIVDLFDKQAYISNCAYVIMDYCAHDASIQELLAKSRFFLKSPMVITDASLYVTYKVGLFEEKHYPAMLHCIEHNCLPNHILASLINEAHLPTLPDFPDIVVLKDNENTIYMIRLMNGRQLLGYLFLFECDVPLTDTEYNLLVILSGFIRIVIGRNQTKIPSLNSHAEDFLEGLLTQKYSSTKLIDKRISLYNLDSGNLLHVLVFRYNTFNTSIDKLHYLKRCLLEIYPSAVIVLYNQNLVMVAEQPNQYTMQRLPEFVSANKLTAGASMLFRDFSEVHKYYRQALACLDMKDYFGINENILCYSDWNIIHLFLQYNDICSMDDLIAQEVKLLMQVDEEKGSALIETLFAFVRNHYDITQAAAELHFHYNTIKYRINRIQEITNIDFKDSRQMFKIIISEQIINIINKKPLTNYQHFTSESTVEK